MAIFGLSRQIVLAWEADAAKRTTSGIVHTGPCYLYGVLIGTDGTNDATVTVYDNTAASGTEVLPTETYDGARKGLDGFAAGYRIKCSTGIYVEITCAGTVEVTVHYKRIS